MKITAIIITVLATITAFVTFSLEALADSVSEFDLRGFDNYEE